MKGTTDKYGSTALYCDGCGSSSGSTYSHHAPRDWETVDERHYCAAFLCQQSGFMARIEDYAVRLAASSVELASAIGELAREKAERDVRHHARAIMSLHEQRERAAKEDESSDGSSANESAGDAS